jgi:hypothetical protein
VVDVDAGPGGLFDQLEGALDDREVAQSEEVHLEESQRLHCPHLVLGDDLGVFALLLDRNQVGQRLGRDHHRSGMDGVLTAQTLQVAGGVDHLPHGRVALIEVAQFLPVGVPVALYGLCLLSRRLQHLGEGGLLAQDGRGHRLGDLVSQPVGMPEDPGRVPDRLLALDGGEGDDLGDVIGPVFLGGVADDVGPVALVEVHVDVGHLATARVEEALEDQLVADRIERRDAQAVGDDRACRRSPPGPGADAPLVGEADQVPHDQEVGGKAHLVDDLQLVLDSLPHLLGEGIPVALLGPLVDQFLQVRDLGVAGGHRELGQQDLAELEVDRGPFHDPQRVVARPGVLLGGEQGPHLGAALDVVVLAARELEPVLVALEGAGLDAQEHVVGGGVLGSGVVGVVGRQQRSVETSGDVDEIGHDALLALDAVILELDEEAVPPEDVLEFAGGGKGGVEIPGAGVGALLHPEVGAEELGNQPAQTPGGGDDALGVFGEEVEVHPGLVVIALEEGARRELHQVAIPGLVLGEQQQVVALVGGAGGAVKARSVGEVGLDADDGRQIVGLGGPDEVDHPVHDAVVGDAHPRLPVLGGDGDHIVDPRRTVQHGVLGVEMEVSEGHVSGGSTYTAVIR